MADTSQPIVLGIDLDGVCADFYGFMRKIAAEYFEKNLEDLPETVTWGMPEWGVRDNEHYMSLHRFAMSQRDLFQDVPMIPGARSTLRKLADEKLPQPNPNEEPKSKYRIRIITHRLFVSFFHEVAVRQTIRWLDYHAIPYSDLCFMKEKGQVGADIYVEDSPSNVLQLRNSRKDSYVICFANSTNTHIGAPRAESWSDVYNLINAWRPTTAPLTDNTAPTGPAPDRKLVTPGKGG